MKYSFRYELDFWELHLGNLYLQFSDYTILGTYFNSLKVITLFLRAVILVITGWYLFPCQLTHKLSWKRTRPFLDTWVTQDFLKPNWNQTF